MAKRFSSTQINSELFWKFPKFLSENKKYADLSNDDRVAYMLIKDRYRYSLSNNWVDEKNDVYVYFTIEDLRQLLHVGKNKVTRVKQHLIDNDLLEIVKQGFNPKTKKNYPDRIYLLQPEYDPEDLISQSSQVRALEQSDFPKMGTNKDKKSIDTIKDTTNDTERWNFSPENYPQEIVAKQNQDLLMNLSNVLSDDAAVPMFLNKESIRLITLWFRTPEQVSECISTILNAANDSRKNALSQIGRHELYFDDYNGELKGKVTQRLRRYFNRMRTNQEGKIKNPKNYLYVTMRNTFDKWQNDVLMAEKKEQDKANDIN